MLENHQNYLPCVFGTLNIAVRTSLWEGEAKTPPHTAAVSMPGVTYPACAGSWPEPPPQMMDT